ncbi:hypothetical protein J1G42_12500 [Cellulomonas sp. zg-ZUI222]|nr:MULTISPECIES: hypothetical protein [Cellulomonas]MBO0900988.1 hypothetical protein [Cellulomonas sp. zg-ZUI22]MBO0921643.1 hypothetical protein [Cellulomonas wangleii]
MPGVVRRLVDLPHDPGLRSELGGRARAAALERYSMDRLVKDYEAVVRGR